MTDRELLEMVPKLIEKVGALEQLMMDGPKIQDPKNDLHEEAWSQVDSESPFQRNERRSGMAVGAFKGFEGNYEIQIKMVRLS